MDGWVYQAVPVPVPVPIVPADQPQATAPVPAKEIDWFLLNREALA